jgi:hypothetical protein
MFKKTLLLLFLLTSSVLALQAQRSDSLANKTALPKSIAAEEEVLKLDTEESIEYLGNELWFQIKKRLHLTSKEEEEEQQKRKGRKISLSIGGIKIE